MKAHTHFRSAGLGPVVLRESMKASEYTALTQSRSVRNTLRALGTLTGLTVKLAPIEPQPKDRLFASSTNP